MSINDNNTFISDDGRFSLTPEKYLGCFLIGDK